MDDLLRKAVVEARQLPALQTITIANPYFVPDEALMTALTAPPLGYEQYDLSERYGGITMAQNKQHKLKQTIAANEGLT